MFYNTKPQGNTPKFCDNIYLLCLQESFPSLSLIPALLWLTVEDTHCCTFLAELLFLVDCFAWNSAVTIELNLLTSFQECLSTGALVQSSVHHLIPSAAVLFRCSLYFPELSVCDMNPCSFFPLTFVSINTEGICKVVQENPFLKEKCKAIGRFRNILWKWGCSGIHSWTRTP